MTKPTLASLDKRVAVVETQLDERWKEAIIRIKRIEAWLAATAITVIGMLGTVILKM
jgi:hypothetical protein